MILDSGLLFWATLYKQNKKKQNTTVHSGAGTNSKVGRMENNFCRIPPLFWLYKYN